MTPYELYREAKLEEAIEAAIREVKAAPTDADRRLLLCDLLCVDHQLERADRQLDLLMEQDATLAGGVSLYRQLIRAALARNEVFEAGRSPEFFGEVADVSRSHLQALMAMREGDATGAGEILNLAESGRVSPSGTCDGEAFDDLRDLDDRIAPFLEVLTSTGKYYWLPWQQIEKVEFKPPRLLRDLVWRQAGMTLRDGPDAVVYVPVVYPGSHRQPDPELRLGRRTDWIESAPGLTIGVGQRTFLVGNGDKPFLTIGTIGVAAVGGAGRVTSA